MSISSVAGDGSRAYASRRKLSVIACGNFGARPKPPKRWSNCPRSRSTAVGEDLGGDRALGAARAGRADRRGLGDRGAQLLGLLEEIAASLAPRLVDRVHHAREPGHALAILLRPVRAAEERAPVGVEEDGHRPSAAAGHRLHRLHVDRVDVGPLLTVDLHAHEPVVHHRGDVGVLERLVRHHVTPVARRVADREQHRLVLGAGTGERLVAPRVPVDGIVGVLAEVRAGLGGQAVHGGSLAGRRRVPLMEARRRSRFTDAAIDEYSVSPLDRSRPSPGRAAGDHTREDRRPLGDADRRRPGRPHGDHRAGDGREAGRRSRHLHRLLRARDRARPRASAASCCAAT